jgi:predicted RNase H-like HicB family nuclease
MNCPYSMLIQWSDEDGSYIVSVPEFGPYSKTHGATYEEAARNGKDVLNLLLEKYQAEGRTIPVPMKFGSAAPQAESEGKQEADLDAPWSEEEAERLWEEQRHLPGRTLAEFWREMKRTKSAP